MEDFIACMSVESSEIIYSYQQTEDYDEIRIRNNILRKGELVNAFLKSDYQAV